MNKYSIAIVLSCLLFICQAQTTFTVTNTDDSGAGSLRQAILDAEANPGADIIDLTGITSTITLSTGLPNITEDLTINGAGSTSTIIDGNSQIRPFFIGGAGVNDTDAPVVNINDLTIQNGYAEGESPQQGNAGAGAGMGGAMFINNGEVMIMNVVFSGNSVLGGTGGVDRFGGGGDGGDGPFENSGGIAAAFPPGAFVGGTGGYGAGGGGAIGNFNFGGADGGRGGYGAGGGGGFGGNSAALGSGGAAGTFGGSGGSASLLGGAGGGGGAGLGGALYVRNGTVTLDNTDFDNNTATGGAGGNATPDPSGGSGQGKGGGIFNHTGTVVFRTVNFSGNTATNAGISTTDNADNYGTVILDDQTPPTFTSGTITNIAENTSTSIYTAIATDLSPITYSLGDQNEEALFLIDANSGELSFLAAPDAEAPGDANTDNVYLIEIIAEDAVGEATSLFLDITVEDANDNLPAFTSSATLSIDEGETDVLTIAVTDADVTASLTYSLSGGSDVGFFSINETSGLLSFSAPQDFEAASDEDGGNDFEVTVAVSDGDNTVTQDVTVTLLNINEAPVFTSSPVVTAEVDAQYAYTIQTADPENDFVTVSTGTLPDGLTLGFIPANTRALSDIVLLQPSTNTLSVGSGTVKGLAANNNGDVFLSIGHAIVKRADDGTISVFAGDINNAGDSDGVGSSARFSDPQGLDADDDGNIYVADQGNDKIKVISANGNVLTIAGASEGSMDGTISSATFKNPREVAHDDEDGIYVLEDGATSASTIRLIKSGQVSTVTANIPILHIAATDGFVFMAGSNQLIRLDAAGASTTLATGDSRFFFYSDALAVDNNQTTIHLFDRPGTTNVASLTVLEQGSSSPTTFIFDSGFASLDESNLSSVQVSLRIDETSLICTSPNGLIYLIDDTDQRLRRVDRRGDTAIEGVPTVTGVFPISITASDGSEQSTQDFNLTISPNPVPVFTSPATVDVSESTVASTVVYSAVATDSKPVTYSLGDQRDEASFSINASSGALTLQDPKDFEMPDDDNQDGIYEVVIIASDGFVTSELTLQVTITDADEPPVITAAANLDLTETELLVGTIQVEDPDMNTALTFFIAGGADAALFEIAMSDGILSATNLLDFETPGDANQDNVYELEIQVTDGTFSDFESITITLIDANEPPSFLSEFPAVINEGFNLKVAIETSDPEGDEVTVEVTNAPDWIGLIPDVGQINTLDMNKTPFAFATSPVDGKVYFYDDQMIYRVEEDRSITHIAGGGNQFSPHNIDAKEARIDPSDLAFDSQGNLFFVDGSARTVARINRNNIITRIAGQFFQTNSTFVAGTATSIKLNKPITISVDSQDRLFLYDDGFDKLLKIESGAIAEVMYDGDKSFEIGQDDHIWSFNKDLEDVLHKYTLEGLLVQSYDLNTDFPASNGGFRELHASSSSSGELWITTNTAIYQFFPGTESFEFFAGNFTSTGFSDDGELLGNLSFSVLRGLAVQENGEVVIRDNQRLRILENVADRAIGGIPTEAAVGDNDFTIRLTDSGGNENLVNKTINVVNVQNPPTGVQTNPEKLDETLTIGASVTLEAIDTDITETHTFTLVAGIGDDDNDAFTISGDQLVVQEALRFEDQSEYLLRIKVDDSGGLSNEIEFELAVNNVIQDPTDITLSASTITENIPVQTLVASFSTTDVDAGDTFTYSFVSGDGDDQNSDYEILGDQLFTLEEIDFESGATNSIRVRSEDSQGGFIEKALTINITDVDDLPFAGAVTSTRIALEDTESFFRVNPRDDDGNVTVEVTSPDWLSLQDFGDGTLELFTGTSTGYTDGDANSAQFDNVEDGVFDESGNLFVADRRNNVIRKITPDGTVSTFAGMGPSASEQVIDGQGTAGSITDPRAITRDDEGNLYVGAFGVIRKIDREGYVTTLAGGVNPTTGFAIRSDADGTGADARFFNIRAMTLGPDGFLYVVDQDKLRKVSLEGEVTTFTEEFRSPTALDFDENGTLYIADDGNRVLKKMNLDGSSTIVAGQQNVFNSSFTTVATPALDFTFGTIYDISFSPDGDLYIANNSTIYRLVEGETIIPVMGFGIVSPTLNFPGFQNNVRWIEATDYGFIAFNSGSVQQFFEISFGQVLSGTPTAADLGMTTVSYTVTDGTGNTANASFDIEVLNTNDVPTGLALDNLTVDELRLPGQLVGTLSTTDEDLGDTFTYTLISGTGDTDNTRFSIDGEQLVTAETFNFNGQTYAVRIQTKDAEGATFEDSFTIEVNDVTNAPPQLSTNPILTATEGAAYNYAFEVQDFDTPPIFVSGGNTFELVTATGTTVPDWLTLNTTPGGLNELLQFELPFKIDPNTNTYYGVTGLNVITSVLGTMTITPLLPSDDLTLATDLAINPNGDVYVVDGQDIKTISGGVLSTLHTFTGTMQRIEFHPDGFLVYIVEEGFEFDLKKLTLAGVESTLASDINYDYGFDVSPNGTIAYAGYVGTNDYEVFRHDATGAALTNISLDLQPWFEFTTEEVSLYLINELAYNASGELYMHIIAAEMDGTLYDMIIDPAEEALWTSTDSYSVGRLEFNGSSLNFQAPGSNPMVASIFAFQGPKYSLTGTPARDDVGINAVTLTLSDINSTVPVNFDIEVDFVNGAPTDINISGTSIDENNALDADLLTFSTVDPDGNLDAFTYTLVSGDGDTDNAEFTIENDGLRGTISYDVESNPGIKSIRVRSTDAAGEFVEVTFDITINDLNEVPTDIALSGDMEVEENLSVGTVIGTLTTTDEDTGDAHTYTLSGIGSDLFQVVGNELQTAASLDFEQATSYTLTITTEDAGQLTFDKDFTITIIDDAPTDITLSNSSVDEGLLTGAIVGTFSTTDSDPNNTFTYSFVSGVNFNAFFEIEGDVLKTKGIFNASQLPSATIRVRTTDAIGESFEKNLTITVNDLDNSAPQLIGEPGATATQGQLYTYGVGAYDFDGDQVTVTSTAPSWLTQFDQAPAVTEFLSENGATNLEIDEDDNVYVIVGSGGSSATNILKYDDSSETTSTLLATDATAISFVDVDDNGAVYFSDNNFSSSSWKVRKLDNGTVADVYSGLGDILTGGVHSDGYLVLVETQTDNTYDIIRTDLSGQNKTTLKEDVGYVSVFEVGEDDNIHYANLATMMAIDIDGDPATSLQPALTTDSQVAPYLYYITDFVMYSDGEAFIMYANNNNGASFDYLVKVTSSGEQQLWRGDVIYEGGKIAANASSEVFFTRDADSDANRSVAEWNQGFTAFLGTPEDSDVGVNDLDITLSDGELSNSYSFTITVENVNDAPESIALSASSIDENNAVGATTATITSDDPDNDTGDSQTYTLVDGEGDTDNGSFEIVGNELKALAVFDHESGDTKSIRIKATDDSNATFEQTLSIEIADLNESPTAINLSGTSVDENEAAGTAIGTLTTIDPDETNDNLVYEIIEGTEFVQLAGSELQSAVSFDFETTTSFTVKVKASDGVENSNTFFTIEETFTIAVGDVSESPSDIALSNSTVAENASSGTIVGELSAQDPDGANTNTFILVENSEDNASFEISEGQLVTVDVFDFENQSSYTVEVAVNDGGGNTFTEKISISITDVNEAPEFSSSSTASIAENTTSIITLTATDVDANAALTYSIVDGTDKDLFTLSGSELAFSSAPDFENAGDAEGDNTYEVTVRVSDGTNDIDQALTITVTDENEAPVFNNVAAVSVEENSTAVTTLSATDQDAGATLTYSVTGGADQGVFSLTGSDLTFVSAPDFESPADADGDNQYEVSVQVSDGTNVVTLEMTVTVTDLTTAPTFTSDSDINVEENSTDVITLVASTSEAGGTLTYNLLDGQDANSFDLDGAVLTFKSAPDFEDPTDEDANNVYALTVRVSDGSSEIDQALSITVTDENEAPVFNTTAEVSVTENSAEVATLSATDQDDAAVLTYSIVGGADQLLFSLSESNMTFITAPDFETPTDADEDNQYEVNVQVTDGTNEVVLNLIVSVIDENEAPIISTAGAQTIPENTAGPITLEATDPDGRSTLTYSIVDGADKDLFSLTGNELSFITAPDFENATDEGVDNDYEVTVFVFDDTHATELNLIVTVTDVNEAPVFNTSAAVSVEENTAFVTSLSATDPDAGATVAFSISGGTDQTAFALSESNLTFTSAPDFESPVDADGDNNYEVEVQASDGTNRVTLSMIVTVTDLTKVPSFTSDSEVSVLENTTEVVTLTVSTEEAVGTSTFSLVEGQDAELFDLDGAELTFKSAADFEAPEDADENNVYLLTVRTSDGTNEVDQAMSITVTNVNEAPTSFSLSGFSVDEGADVGTLVGTLTSTDEDATFTHIYSLLESETNFKISGNELLTNAVFDFDDQPSYDVTIIVTDEEGLTFSATPTITVNELINNKPNSSIDINPVGDVEVGAAPFSLSALTNPENATVVWSVLEGDATIDGSTLTPGTQPGLVVVKAVIEETDDFNASEDTESFNLVDPTLIDPIVTISLPAESPANETVTIVVTFDAQGATSVTETDLTLSVESGPGQITGDELSFTGAGTVEVAASLAATDETNAVRAIASIEVFQVHNISGRALADGDGFSNGRAYIVALDNVNETIDVSLTAEGNFTFENVREGEYFLGVGVPQTETTYLSTFLGDVSPILDQTTAPEILKLSADVSGLVINMQSKPAPAVELIDPETGGKIEFQAQGTTNGQSRFIMGRVEMGDPIPNTQVVLSTAEGAYIADGLTDENGFITFEGLPTGDYKLGVEIPGVGRVETEIPVEEGEQADVTGLISEDGTVALEVEEVLNVGLDAAQAFTIYPNPVAEEMNLKIENDYRGDLTFRVFDMNGRKVLGFIQTKQNQQLEISQRLDIPEGTYVILINGIELSLQQRFIKQ